ncbi:MAG: Dienelactone hydrolase-related enzyme [Verrucomicrobiales bacterium]|nr:Dienelactone hydrolase-related enzyme [Verrucomicrobiales bacterium]
MKSILTSITCLVVALSSNAQDWAKAKLAKSPRHPEWAKVTHGNRTIDCFIVYPEVKDKATTVLVISEVFGHTDWIRDMCDQVAEADYIAIAPDLHSGKKYEDVNDAIKATYALPAKQVTDDLNTAAKYALSLPSSNGKLVVAGFCWGGGQSFKYPVSNKNVKAAFVFYGPPPEKKEMSKINCPVYGFYGGNDNRITSTVKPTEEQMKSLGKVYEPVVYEGAGHGFMRAGEAPDAKPADKKAHDEGWQRFKDLLGKYK